MKELKMIRTKNLALLLFCAIPFIFSGCYEEKVKEAVSKLQVGMSKSDLDHTFKDVEFLKEQLVAVYPNSSEEETRGSFIGNNHYELKFPENVIDTLTFDGNSKVYSYLIRREKIYANPTSIDYVAVFYNQKEDKVLGWAHMRESGDVDTWGDKF